MSGDKVEGAENGRAEGLEFSREDPVVDVVELRLPARSEYLAVLRAAVGAVAGSMSFNYDEIVELRVAVSEAFGLAVRHMQWGDAAGESNSVTTSFVIGPDQLEIRVIDSGFVPGGVENAEEVESRVVLESVVDSAEIGVEISDQRVIRLVKHRPARGS